MNNEFTIKDSGKRESFNGGAVRDVAEEKSRPDLISPFFKERLGEHLRKGARKYSAWNWAKGIPNSRCMESCERHIMQFMQGDRTEDHLCAAAANLMFMIHNEEVAKKGCVLETAADRGLVDLPVFKSVCFTGLAWTGVSIDIPRRTVNKHKNITQEEAALIIATAFKHAGLKRGMTDKTLYNWEKEKTKRPKTYPGRDVSVDQFTEWAIKWTSTIKAKDSKHDSK